MVEDPRHGELDDAVGDLDEDLFDFGEVAMARSLDLEPDQDLDEIFADFQDADQEETARPAPEPEPEREPPPEPAPEPVTAPPQVIEAKKPEVWEPRHEEAFLEPPRRAPDETTAPPAPTAPARAFPTSLLWIFIAVTSLNGLLAVLALRSTVNMHDGVLDAGRRIADTADEIRNHAYDQARALATLQTPVVPTNPEDHPTFARAREEIEAKRYADARQTVYSLLAVVDRLDASQREAVESRAHFLLAQALHLEALERLEEER